MKKKLCKKEKNFLTKMKIPKKVHYLEALNRTLEMKTLLYVHLGEALSRILEVKTAFNGTLE